MLRIKKIFVFHQNLLLFSRLLSTNAQHIQKVSNEENTVRRIGATVSEQNRLVKASPVLSKAMKVLKVAIIGAPNAGKSTLSNKLIGWKFAAVSQKVHTTRKKTLGVLTEADRQVIFLDTPGVIVPSKSKKHNLEKTLLLDPHESLMQTDLIAVVVDVSRLWNRMHLDTEVLKMLFFHKDKPSILILNKVDIFRKKHELLNVVRVLTEGCLEGRRFYEKKVQGRDREHLVGIDGKPYVARKYGDRGDGSSRRVGVSSSSSSWKSVSNDGGVSQGTTNEDNRTGNPLHHHDELIEDKLKYDYTESTDRPKLVKEWEEMEVGEEDVEREGKERMMTYNLRDDDGWQGYYKRLQQIGVEEKGRMGWDGFSEVFMVSAREGDGLFELKNYLLDSTKPAPWIYTDQVVTDQAPKALAEQIVWEKLLDNLPEEIPYQIKVKVAMWHIDEDGLLRAQFDLLCSRKRHLYQLMGKEGSNVRRISMQVKQELMNAFKRDMTLQLIVKTTNQNVCSLRREKTTKNLNT